LTDDPKDFTTIKQRLKVMLGCNKIHVIQAVSLTRSSFSKINVCGSFVELLETLIAAVASGLIGKVERQSFPHASNRGGCISFYPDASITYVLPFNRNGTPADDEQRHHQLKQGEVTVSMAPKYDKICFQKVLGSRNKKAPNFVS
jgi:hypothetical protein